jgi:hypothetical protein
MRRAHGISTKHLQGYIDWLVFKKHRKYMIELKKRRSTTYMGLMRQPSSVNAADIYVNRRCPLTYTVHMANITTGSSLRNGSAINHRKIAIIYKK